MTWISIAIGGALGSISRYGIGLVLVRLDSFPFGTLAVNALGSLIIGLAAGFWDSDQRKTPIALFIITGFCGGFTTFSTFSLEALSSFRKTIDCALPQTSPPPSPSASPSLGWAFCLRNRSKKHYLNGQRYLNFLASPSRETYIARSRPV